VASDYSKLEHLGRVLWKIAWATIWKLLWHRVYFLRPAILRCFGADVGLINSIFASTWVEIPWNLRLAPRTTLGPRVEIYNLGVVSIGTGTVISQDAYLCGGTHDYKTVGMPLIRASITIEQDVWICAGAFIGPGVRIGRGAIVAARAVVVKDVEAWTIVGGNPAKVIGMRNDREAICVPIDGIIRKAE